MVNGDKGRRDFARHCEELSDEAIPKCSAFEWDCRVVSLLAMTGRDKLR